MKFTLLVILLSSGLHRQDFSSASDCLAHLREFEIIAGRDVWVGRCVDSDGETLEMVQEGVEP